MSERYISLAEVRDILAEEQERRLAMDEPQEFDPTTKAAMEHAQKTTGLSAEQALDLVEKARQLRCVDGNDAIAYKIADILPEYPSDVRAIFSKERVALEKSDIEDVLNLVSNYI